MKYFIWIWLFLGAVPLLAYPLVLFGNLMSLCGEPSREPGSFALRATSHGFLLSSLAYPAVYFACAIPANKEKNERPKYAMTISLLPLLYLAIVAGFLYGWMVTDSESRPPATSGFNLAAASRV